MAHRPRSSVAFAALALAGLGPVPAASAQAMRCGWLSNPSPANASLYDKDGEWIIAVQGGRQAEGDWPPPYAPRQWVTFGPGSYGYGCACLSMSVDASTMRVDAIGSARARPLSACRKDPALAGIEQRLK